MSTLVTFSDLARAAYCPRQLYYVRRHDDREPPPEVRERRELAFRYAALRTDEDANLRRLPIDVTPAEYRTALDGLAARDDWDALCDPAARDVLLTGKDCRGVVHKLLAGDDSPSSEETSLPPTPVLVSPGTPPPRGVWTPQTVSAVAAAKALSWEREREIPRAVVEYPSHGVVRTVRLTTQNRAVYRRTLRTVRSLDGPPPRLRGSDKCSSCDYRSDCGVQTRSLRSLLGL